MLRLELKDKNETVLFFDPMKDVKVRKEESKTEVCYELCIDTCNDVCYAMYDSKADRDAAYEYVLTKINEYLFPQIESTMVTGGRTDLDDMFNPSSSEERYV